VKSEKPVCTFLFSLFSFRFSLFTESPVVQVTHLFWSTLTKESSAPKRGVFLWANEVRDLNLSNSGWRPERRQVSGGRVL